MFVRSLRQSKELTDTEMPAANINKNFAGGIQTEKLSRVDIEESLLIFDTKKPPTKVSLKTIVNGLKS